MSTTHSKYHPETYWSEVARRISDREGVNVIAGDDEPYYRYKRTRFLNLLHASDFEGKKVLEVGCGPGGNLMEVLKHQPSSLTGVDISEDMIELAGYGLNGRGGQIDLLKINGVQLPFDDNSFDIVFTATVLQHNTDDNMLRGILREICRVSSDKVVLLERIEKTEKGDELCVGRTLEYYSTICAESGYSLDEVTYINTRVSYFVSGAIRKLFNKVTRREGEAISQVSRKLQKISLPITRPLDRLVNSSTDVAKMVFSKNFDRPNIESPID